MVCWEASPRFVSWASEDLVIQREEREREREMITPWTWTVILVMFVSSSKSADSLCATLSFCSRGISFSLRNSAISLSSSRSLGLRYRHTVSHLRHDTTSSSSSFDLLSFSAALLCPGTLGLFYWFIVLLMIWSTAFPTTNPPVSQPAKHRHVCII